MQPIEVPYCGPAPAPAAWLMQWNLDPWLIAALVAGAAWQWRLQGPGSGAAQRWALAGGWGLLALLFVSPLCPLTSALFWARSAHHLLLLGVAAPLLVLALPERLRRPGPASLPAAAALLQLVLLWLWHAPAVYAAALASDLLYWTMELALLGAGLLLWQAVLAPGAQAAGALTALLGSILQMGLLGAALAFARAPLYAPHLDTTRPWGLTPLEDQQLAGLLMWVPGTLPWLAAALLLAARRLTAVERPAA